jgi:hypothetical protein
MAFPLILTDEIGVKNILIVDDNNTNCLILKKHTGNHSDSHALYLTAVRKGS